MQIFQKKFTNLIDLPSIVQVFDFLYFIKLIYHVDIALVTKNFRNVQCSFKHRLSTR